MYIFELLYKLKHKELFKKEPQKTDFEEDYKNCEHIFAPVDSTKKVLACTKCGLLIKNNPKN